MKQKDKVQFLSRRNARSSASTMQNVMKRKIYVSSARADELKELQERADSLQGAEANEEARPNELDQHASSLGFDVMDSHSACPAAPKVPVLLLGFTEDQVRTNICKIVIGTSYHDHLVLENVD